MKTLELHYDNLLQGEFNQKKLNLLLVFQVNCPGCFLYALPLFNKLYADFSPEDISFLGISTAFEDFDKNTLRNTQELLNRGTLVGETQKHLATQGIQQLPYSIDFPVAMDEKLATGKSLDEIITHICHLNPNYGLWSTFDQQELQKNVLNYLKSQDDISLTFTLNQMKGTPSIMLFNDENQILNMWFGHAKYEDIVEMIKQHNQ
jgi:hypothetical protein